MLSPSWPTNFTGGFPIIRLVLYVGGVPMVVPATMLLTVSVHDDTVAPFGTPTMLSARWRVTRFAAVGAAAAHAPSSQPMTCLSRYSIASSNSLVLLKQGVGLESTGTHARRRSLSMQGTKHPRFLCASLGRRGFMIPHYNGIQIALHEIEPRPSAALWCARRPPLRVIGGPVRPNARASGRGATCSLRPAFQSAGHRRFRTGF
jgi:hypothetical protein